jgi:hypothetical protein
MKKVPHEAPPLSPRPPPLIERQFMQPHKRVTRISIAHRFERPGAQAVPVFPIIEKRRFDEE